MICCFVLPHVFMSVSLPFYHINPLIQFPFIPHYYLIMSLIFTPSSLHRGGPAQPAWGAADQRFHGNGWPQHGAVLCHPGDTAPAHHLEKERHHSQLLGPWRHQRECPFGVTSVWRAVTSVLAACHSGSVSTHPRLGCTQSNLSPAS